MFAVSAGRSLLGDDMGLGKTVQALATAELMARFFHLEKVLIVSPTSLKYQWKTEIEKFTSRTAAVIEGMNTHRRELFGRPTFHKIINYELVFRDLEAIAGWGSDLIILDEAQRIKNWKTRTAKSVKQLESPYGYSLPTRETATQSSPQGLSPLLERGEVSGRAFLKIPMPEPEAIRTLLSSMGALLGALTGRQKNIHLKK